MNINVRVAVKKDMPEIFDLIKELAVFEKEPHAVSITVEDLENYGFGNHPKFHCFVADVDGKVKAMALVYMRFSTWKGPILHLEDLVVKQDMRGHGLGTALLDEVVKYGNELDVKRVSWEVIDWNEPAIEFYEKKGADVKRDWDVVHLDEDGIKNYLSKL
ncbi:GNAT family N-acetyltransferase [Psychroserpens jangbogonensis]|uniref:GNAT family N-acetyltransferase n=1 Tax=Psychroserpens jangbogonensis TaxID=1484460 RepID=UPI00053E3F73|nr:GNAT family N-acetyltransferase [Psychroserpens jangbogonensis]